MGYSPEIRFDSFGNCYRWNGAEWMLVDSSPPVRLRAPWWIRWLLIAASSLFLLLATLFGLAALNGFLGGFADIPASEVMDRVAAGYSLTVADAIEEERVKRLSTAISCSVVSAFLLGVGVVIGLISHRA